ELRVVQVVTAAGRDQELRVHRATEPRVAVVEADVGVGVIPDGAVAETVHRDDVQLVVGAQLLAGELDAQELDLAAAVVRVGPAERHSDETLGEALAARTVHGRRAVDTQTAPVPGGAVVGFDVRRAGHQDGVGCRSGRVDLRATEAYQRRDLGRPTT